MKLKKYPTPNFCIFCFKEFSSDLEGTEEHIIPLYLSGTHIINAATCYECASHINGYFEQRASNTSFLRSRTLLGLKRRRHGKKKTPGVAKGMHLYSDRLNFEASIDENELVEPVYTFLGFLPAGRTTGLSAAGISRTRVLVAVGGDNPFRIQCALSPSITLRGRNTFNLKTYVLGGPYDHTIWEEHDPIATQLQIAKIGYCYAAAERGVDFVKDLDLGDLIRGHRTDSWNFVGCSYLKEDSTQEFHKLSMEYTSSGLLVKVRLFASLQNSPVYHVHLS